MRAYVRASIRPRARASVHCRCGWRITDVSCALAPSTSAILLPSLLAPTDKQASFAHAPQTPKQAQEDYEYAEDLKRKRLEYWGIDDPESY